VPAGVFKAAAGNWLGKPVQAGHIAIGGTAEEKCPTGTYPNMARSECIQCTAGHTCLDGVIKSCPNGYWREIDEIICEKCPQNAKKGTTGCEECPVNQKSNPYGTECVPCVDGKIRNSGDLECSWCPAGKGFDATTNNCQQCELWEWGPDKSQLGGGKCASCRLHPGRYHGDEREDTVDKQARSYGTRDDATKCLSCGDAEGLGKVEGAPSPCIMFKDEEVSPNWLRLENCAGESYLGGKYFALSPKSDTYVCKDCPRGQWHNDAVHWGAQQYAPVTKTASAADKKNIGKAARAGHGAQEHSIRVKAGCKIPCGWADSDASNCPNVPLNGWGVKDHNGKTPVWRWVSNLKPTNGYSIVNDRPVCFGGVLGAFNSTECLDRLKLLKKKNPGKKISGTWLNINNSCRAGIGDTFAEARENCDGKYTYEKHWGAHWVVLGSVPTLDTEGK
tara:strand:- start:40 stop:1380 length:1341 start_codon:yes stop_codon:yes gene_type:complete